MRNHLHSGPPRAAAGRRQRSLAAAISALLLALAGCGQSPAPAPPPPDVGTTFDRPVPSPVRTLPLTDSTGRSTSLAAFAGKVVVVSDSLTLCQEDCPLDTTNIVTAARAVDAAGLADRVEFLTITVDPQRDNPARLAAYRKLYAAGASLPNWKLVTGTPADIRALWSYLGVYYKRVPTEHPAPRDWLTNKPLTYDVDHADEVIVFDQRGHERFVLSGRAYVRSTSTVPGRLRHFLDGLGRRHLDRPAKQAWKPGSVLRAVGWLTGRRLSLVPVANHG